jgi:anti-anti-sigma regulatory factor
MPRDGLGPGVGRPDFAVETGHLRPAVPIVRVRGRLDGAGAADLGHALGRCLDESPWAIVLDLSEVADLRPDAVPALIDVAYRAGRADIGLYLVTSAGADWILGDSETAELFEICYSIDEAERALGGQP